MFNQICPFWSRTCPTTEWMPVTVPLAISLATFIAFLGYYLNYGEKIWNRFFPKRSLSHHKSKSALKSVKTRYVHEWKIEDFKQRFSMVKDNVPDSNIVSSPFCIDDGDLKHEFQIFLSKHNVYRHNERKMDTSTLSLEMISKNSVDMAVAFSGHNLFDSNEWNPNTEIVRYNGKHCYFYKCSFEFPKQIKTHEAHSLFVNMEIHRWLSQDQLELPPEPTSKGFVIERTKLDNLSDFKMVCDNTEIKVHKLVLASNCEYFAGMFQNDCLESKNNIMKVVDIDSATLKTMIEMMYTHQPDILPCEGDSLLMLLKAADMYGFEFLHNCIQWKVIKDVLDVESSAYWLKYALHFNAPFLKAQSKQLLLSNLFFLSKTDEFALLVNEFPGCLHDEK